MDSADKARASILALKQRQRPTSLEMLKLIRFYINHEKHSNARILEELAHWDRESVEKTIEHVEKENQKPKPKRFYVSLKEPLEDTYIR